MRVNLNNNNNNNNNNKKNLYENVSKLFNARYNVIKLCLKPKRKCCKEKDSSY